jgi:taurine dioxygenase
MTVSVQDLSPDLPFGRIVSGLTHQDIADEGVCAQLRALWDEAGFILFRGCAITEQFHVDLSRVFGKLEVHRTKEALDPNNPELITLSSQQDPVELEVEGQRGDQFQNWHKDSIYLDRINQGGILRAIKPSSRGGLTGFVDLADVHDRLPDALKSRIEDLRVVYRMDLYDDQRYSQRRRITVVRQSNMLKSMAERRDRDFPPVSHPLIYTMKNGRKTLNFSPVHPQYVEGMPAEESHALLMMLSDMVFDSPAYHHRWSTDEMLLWDNLRMVHMVSLAPSDEKRVMQRTTIAGDYALGRTASTIAA